MGQLPPLCAGQAALLGRGLRLVNLLFATKFPWSHRFPRTAQIAVQAQPCELERTLHQCARKRPLKRFSFLGQDLVLYGYMETWRVGIRYKRTVNTGATVSLEYSNNSGSSWTSVSALGSSATFATLEGTFTTNSGTLPNRPRLRISSTAVAGSKYVVDRVWLFRDGVEDDDDTYIGNGPSVGFYTAQRALLRARTDGRAYEIGVADRTRDNPTAFPDDALSPAMTARVIVPSRSVDVQQTIAEVKRDLLQPLQTTISVGALKRRLTRIVT